jgi:hypothetical protein
VTESLDAYDFVVTAMAPNKKKENIKVIYGMMALSEGVACFNP